MAVHVVLVYPQIPNNTGNIGRLCLATNSTLHLIKPLGFEISDARLKRAGLDYWPHLNVTLHESFNEFLAKQTPEKLHLFTARGKTMFWDVDFKVNQEKDIYLVFGREADGLPQEILELEKQKNIETHALALPMFSDKVRSYNLSNTVAMAVMEVLRQYR